MHSSRSKALRVLLTGGSGFIGTNLVDALLARGADILNLDTQCPSRTEHRPYWRECSVLDAGAVAREVDTFAPRHIVHLAARTDLDGTTLQDYRVNTDGTAYLLAAIKQSASVERLIVTSTQYVHQYHGVPAHDEDFAPHTVYGQSKVVTEQATRTAGLTCAWTIIRPTTVWGPWHLRYPREFWKALARGVYVHPEGRTIKSYGYVGNVVFQILCLLDAPSSLVDRRVFYVGDRPLDLYDWADGFAIQQTGRHARRVPTWCFKALATAGEVLARAGLPSPLTMSRYRNMTTSNPAPMEPIHELCGEPPYTLDTAIAETVAWLRLHYPEIVTRPPDRPGAGNI